jgi:hypothetical protein
MASARRFPTDPLVSTGLLSNISLSRVRERAGVRAADPPGYGMGPGPAPE